MHNVSKNMFKDSDASDSDIDSDDERLEGWKPPTASGADNSKALSSYEDIASGNVSSKFQYYCGPSTAVFPVFRLGEMRDPTHSFRSCSQFPTPNVEGMEQLCC